MSNPGTGLKFCFSNLGNWWCVDTTESRRTRPKKDKNFLIKVLEVLFVLFWLYMLYVFGSWIFTKLVFSMAQVSYLDSACFHQGQTVQAWVFKKEYLIYPQADGTISFSVQEGEKVRPNQELGNIIFAEGSVQILQADFSGLFSKNVDNLENALEDYNNLNSLKTKSRVAPKAVCKVIDNLSPVQLYFEIDNADSWQVNKPVTLIWQGAKPENKETLAKNLPEEIVLKGKVIWGSKAGILVEVNNCPDQLLLSRQASLFLSTRELTGYLVPKTALLTQPDPVRNLCYLSRGQVKLEPVEILAELDEGYLIDSSNLSSQTRYVENVRWIKEGEQLE